MAGPILVAGAGGQVGRALLALGAGDAMVGLSHAELDLTDPADIEAAFARHRPAVVINAAAYTAVDAAEDDEAAAFAVNADGAGRLARAAAASGSAFVHLSTDYVFDGASARPYREDDPEAPINAYGRSKLAGERQVFEAHPAACVVRTSWVYADRGRNFVRTMLDLAASRQRVTVVADQRGSPTYALDLAAALLRLVPILVAGKGPRLLHLSGAGETTWFGLAQAVFARLHEAGRRPAALAPISAADWPTRARRPANSTLDCRLASETYGLVMPDWQDGLRRCLDRIWETGQPG